MGSTWLLADIDELEFAATATLLAIKAKQQSLSVTEQPEIQSSDESELEDDEEEDWATSKPTARLSTSARDALVVKFLDRLAEVFAREKSSIQRGSKEGSKHVAATAWIRPSANAPLTIMLAKNEGLDDRDRKMTSQLQLWLRTIAATGRHSSVSADILWKGDMGLVAFSRSRLWYYISQISQLDQPMSKLGSRPGIYAPVVICLQSLCQNATEESTLQQLSDIVNIAYILRDVWKDAQVKVEHRKALRFINMLGRLRAAYECFRSVALTFEGMSTMEIKPTIRPQSVQIQTPLFRKHLQRLSGEYELHKGILKKNTALKYTGASRLHIHAEMQVLGSLANNADWHQRAHRYIGVSKKLCFLCSQILRNYNRLSMKGVRQPAFTTRQSHGKVYPLWTLPHIEAVSPVTRIAMATAMTNTYHHIQQLLQHQPVLQEAIAESSAGVTDATSTFRGSTAIKKQYVANQRAANSLKKVSEREDSIILGRKIKSVRVGSLPANGSKPRLISINFHALPEKNDDRIRERGHDYVPDFGEFWGECQHDRRFRILTLENQAIKELEGDYRVYWNENDELPKNENIKKILGIKNVDFVSRFWYGNVFVVRFTEHPITFAYDVLDVPETIFEGPHLHKLFQHMWENRFLEDEAQRDGAIEGHFEKVEADKEIILRRMLVSRDHTSVATSQS